MTGSELVYSLSERSIVIAFMRLIYIDLKICFILHSTHAIAFRPSLHDPVNISDITSSSC